MSLRYVQPGVPGRMGGTHPSRRWTCESGGDLGSAPQSAGFGVDFEHPTKEASGLPAQLQRHPGGVQAVASGFPQLAGGMFLADSCGHQLLAHAADDPHRIIGPGD